MERGTILVVDDEPNIADLIELYLSREGFQVVKAATGEGAVQAVAEHRPRLVVLDVGLPDIDGLEVCRRLRQTSTIPVIFLTARDSEVDRVVGLELGADDYVTKPFSPARARRAREGRVAPHRGPVATAEIIQVADVTIDLGRREVRVRGDAIPFTTRGVRAAAVPRGATRPGAEPASRSSTACGATTGSATRAPSTCTSRRSARSSTARCASTPCAESDTGWSSWSREDDVRRGRSLGTRLVVAMVLAVGRGARPLVRDDLLPRAQASCRRTRSPTCVRARPSCDRSSATLAASAGIPDGLGARATRLRGDAARRPRRRRSSARCSSAPTGAIHDIGTASGVRAPAGVTASDLDVQQLLAGNEVSGRHGNTVFLAIPAPLDRAPASSSSSRPTRSKPRCSPARRRWLAARRARGAPARGRRRGLVRPPVDAVRSARSNAPPRQLASGDLSRPGRPAARDRRRPRRARRHAQRDGRAARSIHGAASARSCSRSRTTCAHRSRRSAATRRHSPTERSTTPIPTAASAPPRSSAANRAGSNDSSAISSTCRASTAASSPSPRAIATSAEIVQRRRARRSHRKPATSVSNFACCTPDPAPARPRPRTAGPDRRQPRGERIEVRHVDRRGVSGTARATRSPSP